MMSQTTVVSVPTTYQISDFTYQHQTVFFDIETTGFSAASSFIYLIGCAFFEDGSWKICQWFAKDVSEEKQILRAFLKFLRPYFIAITYNGLGFDIPFIRERCQQHHLRCSIIERLQMVDIYKKLSPYRHFFPTSSLKQSDIEDYFECRREDDCSGRQLISLYHDYQSSLSEESLHHLFLHNHYDVQNMISILPILAYEKIFREQWLIDEISFESYHDSSDVLQEEAILKLRLLTPLPKRISHTFGVFYAVGYQNTFQIRIPIYQGELKYFISDYKNYYYLPNEDTAIHKSIAFYVDKDFRTQAKAATCYSKKNGFFLPQYRPVIQPYFKKEYKDKITYFECTDDFLKNEEQLKKYASHILKIKT